MERRIFSKIEAKLSGIAVAIAGNFNKEFWKKTL